MRADVAIIGAGIVGLATAYRLVLRHPSCRAVILEKETGIARHQSGHNSGVLHSGIYYRPGSLRATNCQTGKIALEEFCAAEGIDYELCGKVIVAVEESELPALHRIHERGQKNGVECQLLDVDRLGELEPHTAGIAAIHVPGAGVVDFHTVCEHLAARFRERSGEIRTGVRVRSILRKRDSNILETDAGEVEAAIVINCAGLHCDRVIRSSGQQPEARIVPFRGEYYKLKPEAQYFCRALIYPVPDASFPFLGVHFTRGIDGEVECGPNAVLALSREGYRWRDWNLIDLAGSLTYPGFLRLAARHWRTGLGEMWRSFSKRAFVRALRRLVPELRIEHLEPAPAGVRAQALTSRGDLVDDFLFVESDRAIHVNNAPSPAATSCLAIADRIVDDLESRLDAI